MNGITRIVEIPFAHQQAGAKQVDKHLLLLEERRDSAVAFYNDGQDCFTHYQQEQPMIMHPRYEITQAVKPKANNGQSANRRPQIPRLSRRERQYLRQLDYELRMAWRPIGKHIASGFYEASALAEAGIPPTAA